MSSQESGSFEEQRSFHYFRTCTAKQLSGFYGSELWDRFVLQATHHEPALRHAVIALGSLHEKFQNKDLSTLGSNLDAAQGGFALTQYIEAIRHLTRPSTSGRHSIEVCLMSCMLFASIEVKPLYRLQQQKFQSGKVLISTSLGAARTQRVSLFTY